MTKQFTKADMKVGYLCRRRDGIWIRWACYRDSRFSGFSSDLTHKDDSDRDIMIVINDDGNRLFKREEPKMIKIGDVEVVAGVTEPLEFGQKYYFVNLDVEEKYIGSIWANDTVDYRRLRRGLIHLAAENAIAMAKAMLAFDKGGE